MPPVLRSFAVFQDNPAVDPPKQQKSMLPLKPATRSSSSRSENSFCPDHPPITATDKENLHPVTGERAGLGTADKKRKDGSSILVTKLHNPPPRPLVVKKHKKELSITLKDEGSPAKKRRASTLAVGTGQKVLKAKAATVAKDTKAPTKPRKATTTKRTTTRPRTLSTLPKVVEEASAGDGSQEGEVKPKKAIQSQLSQADIDSRCYELTVKPLADVSQAYDDTFDVVPVDDKPKFQTAKESSIEPGIRDYFAPPIAGSASLQLGSSRKSPFEEPAGSTKTFSTPERKAIYAAFTFSSPSPSGERFSKTTRAGPIPRLELA